MVKHSYIAIIGKESYSLRHCRKLPEFPVRLIFLFPADEWLNELRTAPALINKIKVWASFHPEMTSVEKFVRQLHTLHNAGIQVCAGAVGNPLAKNILADLRNTLSPDIYLFINAMQGLKSPLSNEDIRFFTQLDNLFEYDLRNAPAQWENCSGGRSACFIDWKGDIFACPRSKVKIGNLYRSQKARHFAFLSAESL